MDLQRQKQFLHHFVVKRREMAQPVLTKAFVQLAKTATMCYHLEGDTHLPLSHLAQNLCLKQIALTENVRPKYHDEYIHHQWLTDYT